MSDSSKVLALIVIVAVISTAIGSMFTVSERERAIRFRFGEIIKHDYEPGWHWKLPFIESVRKFDRRILTLDAEPEEYLTSEKKNVIVDSYVKWRIDDITRYFTATGGDAVNANSRLAQIIKNGLRDEIGKRTIQDVISGERSQIMDLLTVQANKQVKELGIEVVDVRIIRIEYAAAISTSVYQRMEAERQRVAKDLRSRGAEAAEKIRADADRQRTVILAEAYRDAERVRGEGDAVAADIYAKAFSRNPEFYSFYRSLTAYKNSLTDRSDVIVLKPDSEFFKYFSSARGVRR
jgi:membrane protease subunit HflC